MRKLLILIVVLGMASMASAGLQISVGGVLEPIDSEIIVTEVPSGELTLDIWTDADIGAFSFQTNALIATNSSIGTVDGSSYTSPLSFTLVGQVEDFSSVGNPAGSTGVFGGWFTAAAIPTGGILYDDILFHCEGPGDSVLELWELTETSMGSDVWLFTNLLDTVIIHQVPEPMTMVLLGLGGLFLRRRK